MGVNIWIRRIRNWVKNPKFAKSRNYCQACWSNESRRWQNDSSITKRFPKLTKFLCDYCYNNLSRPEHHGMAISAERRAEMKIPYGHVLGPKVNGVRGVYDMRRARR